ncbi:MAG: dihydroorotase [Burkholderiaceae bacterium]
MRLSIRNARLIDPRAGIDRQADLHIAQGRIVARGAAPAGFEAEREIDASGSWVLPGLVDLAARLREPGHEYMATLDTELDAALAGGVTALCCPPDTDPPLDEPGLVEMLKHRARLLDGARVYPLGALSVGLRGEIITEMGELSDAGCIGFAQPGQLVADLQLLLRAMQYAHTFGYTVWLQPRDANIGRDGVAHAGPVASRLGLAAVPTIAETIALNAIFDLVRETGCRVHLCRISSAAGVELVRSAKAEGLPISADVAVHHLHLVDVDIGFFDSRYRVDPPFRSQRDRAAIRAGVRDGTIDVICSDHAPVDDDAKHLPFGEAEPGITGLELLLPLTLKWASEGGIAPLDALRRVTIAPAEVAGIEAGTLEPGAVADVCIYAPDEPWLVGRSNLRSQSVHTPYLGLEMVGRVRQVLVSGRLVGE